MALLIHFSLVSFLTPSPWGSSYPAARLARLTSDSAHCEPRSLHTGGGAASLPPLALPVSTSDLAGGEQQTPFPSLLMGAILRVGYATPAPSGPSASCALGSLSYHHLDRDSRLEGATTSARSGFSGSPPMMTTCLCGQQLYSGHSVTSLGEERQAFLCCLSLGWDAGSGAWVSPDPTTDWHGCGEVQCPRMTLS